VKGLGVNWRFFHLKENLRAQMTLKTPIPLDTFNTIRKQGGEMPLPRDVTSVEVLKGN
jgi:hypothetical protein